MTRVHALKIGLLAGLAWSLALPALAQSAPPAQTPAQTLAGPPDPTRCKTGAETTLADCDAALLLAADPKTRAERFFVRAYLENERQKYESALHDLNEALALDPGNPRYLHERGYTESSLGHYEDAVRDLDAQIKQQPAQADAYVERAFAEFPLARFEDDLRDRSKAIELKPDDGYARLARATVLEWLGRFGDASKDIDDAARLAETKKTEGLSKDVDRERKRLSLLTTPSGAADPGERCNGAFKASEKDSRAFGAPKLIGDCTTAYFKTTTASAKADLLTARSIAWEFNGDEHEQADDLTIATALEPDNPDRHINLGFVYLSGRHSWAAEKEFDKAIPKTTEKDAYIAYAGRASARYNQGDFDGAFADAKKSFELKPNEACLYVLGDLAMNQRHDPKSAKLYWMGAYRLGSRDDSLLARLKSVGVDDPSKEKDEPPAKK